MNKFYIIFLLLCPFIFAHDSKINASALPLTSQEKAWIKTHPVIRVHNENKWVPFNYIEKGEPKGYSIDFIKLIAKKAGLKIQFVQGYTWEEYVNMLKNKQIDVISNMVRTPTRTQFTLFTKKAIHNASSAIYAQKRELIFKNLESLQGYKVSVLKGSWQEELIEKLYPKIKLVPTQSTEDAIKLVEQNQVDAVIDLGPVIRHIIDKNQIKNLMFHSIPDYENLNSYHERIGIRNDWPELKSIFDKAMASLSYKELQTLNEIWFVNNRSKNSDIKISFSLEEQQYLKEKKHLKICVLPSAMPFEAINDKNEHIGMSSDIVKIIEKRIGVPIFLQATRSWMQSHEYIKEGKCDFIPFLQNTPLRQEYLRFTKPYLEQTIVIATRHEELFIKHLNAIQNKKVAIIQGYAFNELIKQHYPHIQIVAVKNIQEGLKKVQNEEVFGYIDVLGSIGYELKRQGNYEIKISGKVGFNVEESAAVSKENTHLLSILQKAYGSLSAEDLQGIYNKWVTVDFEQEIDYSLIYKIGGFLILIILGTMYWNRKLQAEINKRIAIEKELILARQEALNASKAKSEFLANMSHEIRTPMNGVLGMISLALKKLDTDKEKSRNFMRKSYDSAQMLLGIINDILDFSKIEAGKLEIEHKPMSLKECISRINDLFAYTAKEKRLDFIIEQDELIPDFIMGDSLRLSQVLSNLVANAIKFTQKGFVKIRIELIKKDDKDIVLKFLVQDTGKGIEKDKQHKLFKSFSQEDSSISRKYGGTGLGLTISKQLIEAMNGKINFKSKKNKGSTFYFTLKTQLAFNHEQLNKNITHSNYDFKTVQTKVINARILLVEDNEINQELAYNFLKEMVTDVVIASNGQEAIKVLTQYDPHYFNAILMDIHMPIMDGYEATKKIKTLNKYVHIPIIAMTANALKKDIKKSKKLGMCDHIPKPFDVNLLQEKVHFWAAQTPYLQEQKQTLLNDQAAIERMMYREDLYKNFLIGFLKNKDVTYETIEKQLKNKDCKKAIDTIHTLKGIVNTMGAEDLGLFLLECETILKECEKLTDTELQQLKIRYDELLVEVNKWINSH